MPGQDVQLHIAPRQWTAISTRSHYHLQILASSIVLFCLI